MDDLIDVIEGNRKYMKCIYVYNKIDVVGIYDMDHLARQPNSVFISCNLEVNSLSFRQTPRKDVGCNGAYFMRLSITVAL